MSWLVEFHPAQEHTAVHVEITFASEQDMQTIIEMGFETGFTMAHGNLDELLATLLSA